ncbi:MAG: helix-turn-helix domain-containing protein [Bacteroides sp.]|nr:helix-turn-helix domain-containing protein [Bacteroides sp.]
MKISLGENLRALRNKENVTQEQLSEALEVSPQAVSRWENEASFPDISILPVIANYFNVTVDYLLGVDTVHKQRETDKAIEIDTKLRNEGKTRESVDFLREKVKEFPSNPEILHRLACSLFSLYHQRGDKFSEEESRAMAEESVELCKRALKYNSDQPFVSCCKQTLVLNYVELGERERAAEIADTLSSLWCSREMVYPTTLTGKEALKEYQENLTLLIDAIVITMGRIKGCENYTDEQLIELAEVREKLILLLAGDNPCRLNERLFNMAMIQAKIQARKNSDKLADTLQRLIKYSRNYEERQAGGKYKVFWLSECTDRLGSAAKHSPDSLYDTLRNFIDKNGIKERFMGDKKVEAVIREIEELA